MSSCLRLIPASSPQWSAWVDRAPHDFHHTAAHHLIWQESGAGEPWLAVVGSPDRYVAWPHLLRKIDNSPIALKEDLYDVTDVDGYCGPLTLGCSRGDPFLRAALDSVFDHWRNNRVVCVFTRFHPLLMNQFCFADPLPPGISDAGCTSIPGLRHEGHTVSMNLSLTDAEARSEYRECHSRQIRRALRAGLTTEVDNGGPAFREFVDLYYQTMQRNGASPRYYFSKTFLDNLRNALGSGVSIHHARLGDKTAAAVFITEFGGIVQYLLGGVHDDFCSLSPLKLLLDSVRQWARSRGNQIFHLGGGRGCQDEDPLFFFKAGFSKRRHCFYTGRWILDPERYTKLTREHLGNCASDFFPGYRAHIERERAMETIEV